MKTKLIFILLSGLIASGINAQEKQYKKTPAQRATIITAHMKKYLNLRPKQVEKVQAINLKYTRLHRIAKKNLKGQGQKLKQRKLVLIHDRNQELKKVLTAEQYTKYKKHVKKVAEKRKQKKLEKKGKKKDQATEEDDSEEAEEFIIEG